MSFQIQNQGLPVDSSSDLRASSTQPGAATDSTKSTLTAPTASADTASISAATSQLSGDVAIRQDRVDSLRAQIESGTYTVNPRAVATAMFQNLFRS